MLFVLKSNVGSSKVTTALLDPKTKFPEFVPAVSAIV